ncbi:MAG: ATP-binding protein, partial [Chitinophagia bacterium]|nr:ATP-binding protein [Chitinophagia bacterium]
DGRVLNMICANKAAFGKFDKALIRHAIVNLLNNAFKYSPGKPSPEFSISSVDNTTILEIKDYGIGIPEAEMDKLYDSFFRASNVGAISGTGIGLMVVDYSIKLHKGSIKVDSTLHKGTTFTITLNS